MKPKSKKTWELDIDMLEGDVNAVILKHLRPDFPSGTVVISGVDKPPETGFFFVMISKREDEMTVLQVGQDIELSMIERAFSKILKSLYFPDKDERIGIA